MKRIFIGISYILMIVMLFVYILIPCLDGNKVDAGYTNVFSSTVDTGLSVIGLVFIFPAFIFTILSLCNDKAILNFLRDVFALFAGLFILAATIVMVSRSFYAIYGYFVPVILGICSIALIAFAAKGVIDGIRLDNFKKKEEKEE